MDQTILPIFILAFVLGMRHALDADHLAAVSTLLAGRPNRARAALVGTWWGLGHAAALLTAGGLMIVFDLRFPDAVSIALEFCVGAMLIFLGARVFVRLKKGGTLHVHTHRHDGRIHIHPHIHDGAPPGAHDDHASRQGARPQPVKSSLFVGMVHGLAGSAGLMLVLLPSMPTRLMGVVYLALFGAGSILGMTLATFLVSIPLGTIGAGGRTGRIMSAAAGCLSLVIGGMLVVETGGALLAP